MALTEEQKQKVLKNVPKVGEGLNKIINTPRPEGRDLLPKRPAATTATTVAPVLGGGLDDPEALPSTPTTSVVTRPTDISQGFTTQESTGFSQSVPTADEITKSIAFNESQRKQGGQGFQGATTGDFSGTGINADKSPLGVITDSQRKQLSSNRGFSTQLTKLGGLNADGSRLTSRGGTFSTVGSSRTPVEQLSSLRETFGSPGGRSTAGGGFGVAPNSAARERNARLNDPSNQLLSDLQRQVRSGQISARAAGGIAATLLGQQQDATTARERIAAQSIQSGQELGFKRDQLQQTTALGREKLAADNTSNILDRDTRLRIAQQKALQDAEKLGLDRQTFAELQRRNLAQEQLGQQRLGLTGAIAEAKLGQEAGLQGQKTATARLGDSVNILRGLSEGAIQPDQAASLLTEMFGPETASQLLGSLGADLFTTNE